MKLILLLILIQCVILIECELYFQDTHNSNLGTQKRDLSKHKRQALNLHENSMTEEHKGSRKGSRFNSTKNDETIHSDWDSSGNGRSSHSYHHQNEQNSQYQEEESYHRSGNFTNGGPWKKPNTPLNPFGNRTHNASTLKPSYGNDGQGFQDGYSKQPDDVIDQQSSESTTSSPKKGRKGPWKKRRCNPYSKTPCTKPHTEDGFGKRGDRIPGKKGPKGGQSTPNGNNQGSGELINNGEDIENFNSGLF